MVNQSTPMTLIGSLEQKVNEKAAARMSNNSKSAAAKAALQDSGGSFDLSVDNIVGGIIPRCNNEKTKGQEACDQDMDENDNNSQADTFAEEKDKIEEDNRLLNSRQNNLNHLTPTEIKQQQNQQHSTTSQFQSASSHRAQHHYIYKPEQTSNHRTVTRISAHSEQEEGEIVDERGRNLRSSRMRNNNSNSDYFGPGGDNVRSSGNTAGGSSGSNGGQGVWNNQKRIFEQKVPNSRGGGAEASGSVGFGASGPEPSDDRSRAASQNLQKSQSEAGAIGWNHRGGNDNYRSTGYKDAAQAGGNGGGAHQSSSNYYQHHRAAGDHHHQLNRNDTPNQPPSSYYRGGGAGADNYRDNPRGGNNDHYSGAASTFQKSRSYDYRPGGFDGARGARPYGQQAQHQHHHQDSADSYGDKRYFHHKSYGGNQQHRDNYGGQSYEARRDNSNFDHRPPHRSNFSSHPPGQGAGTSSANPEHQSHYRSNSNQQQQQIKESVSGTARSDYSDEQQNRRGDPRDTSNTASGNNYRPSEYHARGGGPQHPPPYHHARRDNSPPPSGNSRPLGRVNSYTAAPNNQPSSYRQGDSQQHPRSYYGPRQDSGELGHQYPPGRQTSNFQGGSHHGHPSQSRYNNQQHRSRSRSGSPQPSRQASKGFDYQHHHRGTSGEGSGGYGGASPPTGYHRANSGSNFSSQAPGGGRGGYRDQGGSFQRGMGRGGAAAGAAAAAGDSQSYYMVEGALVSKSNYHNPNNPQYLGKHITRGGAKHHNQGHHHQHQQRAYNHDDYPERRDARDSSPPPYQGHHRQQEASYTAGDRYQQQQQRRSLPRSFDDEDGKPVGNKADEPHSQDHPTLEQPAMATKKMSIAASSPSRVPLEIVRQVPVVKTSAAAAASKPSILQEEEADKHLQAVHQNSSDREPMAADHEKQEEDEVAQSYASPVRQHSSGSRRSAEGEGNLTSAIASAPERRQATSSQQAAQEPPHSKPRRSSTNDAVAIGDQSSQQQQQQKVQNQQENNNMNEQSAGSQWSDNKKDLDDEAEIAALIAHGEVSAQKLEGTKQLSQQPQEQQDTGKDEMLDEDEGIDNIPAFDGLEEKIQRAHSRSDEDQKLTQELNRQNTSNDQQPLNHEDKKSPQGVQIEEHEVQPRPNQKVEKVIIDNQGKIIDPKDNCNIYVAGIQRKTTEDNLRKVFSQFGSILRVSVIKDFDTKQPRGFAYILFKNGKEANMAIEKMNQTNPFNEWNITVEHAKRGEIVTQETINKHQKNMQQKPYGSSSFGYEGSNSFGGGGGYGGGGRGNRGGYGGSSYGHRSSFNAGASGHHNHDSSRDHREHHRGPNADYHHSMSRQESYESPGDRAGGYYHHHRDNRDHRGEAHSRENMRDYHQHHHNYPPQHREAHQGGYDGYGGGGRGGYRDYHHRDYQHHPRGGYEGDAGDNREHRGANYQGYGHRSGGNFEGSGDRYHHNNHHPQQARHQHQPHYNDPYQYSRGGGHHYGQGRGGRYLHHQNSNQGENRYQSQASGGGLGGRRVSRSRSRSPPNSSLGGANQSSAKKYDE